MKTYLTLFACLLTQFGIQANCTNAYASAGYSLAHAKKSLSSNNFEHQQYYADRSLQAFEKAKLSVEQCGCDASLNPIMDGIENLENALAQTDWDMGRYFTKRALENAQNLLESLDICSNNDAPDPNTTSGSTLDETAVQEETLTQNTSLVSELESQINFQRSAETDIKTLENAIRELALLFECDKAMQILKGRKVRAEDDLRPETMAETKSFYISQVVSMHNKALFALLECSKQSN
jgi:hypothetical protein